MQIFNTIPATTIIQKKIQESFPEFFWDIDTNKLDIKDHSHLRPEDIFAAQEFAADYLAAEEIAFA